MEFALGYQGVFIKVFFKEIDFMDMERCFGQMVIFIEDGGVIISKMGKDNCLCKAKG